MADREGDKGKVRGIWKLKLYTVLDSVFGRIILSL